MTAAPGPHSPDRVRTPSTRLTELSARLTARVAGDGDGAPSSLADGAAGVALLHLGRARTGHGDPGLAHAWLGRAAAAGVPAGPDAGLFHGAPALAFTLHTAAEGGGYIRALHVLDEAVLSLTRQRLDVAHRRIDRRRRPGFAEYDVLRGLTGLGAHHLRRHPHHPITAEVLIYLVRLTQPLRSGDDRPAWWTHHGPDRSHAHQHPDGHANLGMAHGITGPLALLALAARHGVVVDGQIQAIRRICAWLDTWRLDSDCGHHWPEIVTLAEHHAGRVIPRRPGRPSWCYGTPGIARALQLAAIATSDPAGRRVAEEALLACLRDPAQIARISASGLCHGHAGLLLTVWRAARDAETPSIAEALATYLDSLAPEQLDLESVGFLDGAAGLALALHTVGTSHTATSWDRCLLTT